jgi:hypothetical protein
MKELVPKPASRTVAAAPGADIVPAVIADAGDHAVRRFLEFFAATIRNKNTRMAYYRAACHFFAWIVAAALDAAALDDPRNFPALLAVRKGVKAITRSTVHV